LYAIEIEVKKLGGGDLPALNGTCQLSSGFEIDRNNVMGRFDSVLYTTDESTGKYDDCTKLKNLLDKLHNQSSYLNN
jgi:hypothetical protein